MDKPSNGWWQRWELDDSRNQGSLVERLDAHGARGGMNLLFFTTF